MVDVKDHYLITRGLYWRPDSKGYTGIRDEAGLFTKEYASARAESLKDHGSTRCALRGSPDAPEFMPAAYHDLVVKHLQAKVARLAAALTPVAASLKNESTQHPWWAIVQPVKIGTARGRYAIVAGPFFSREAAHAMREARAYAWPKDAIVYCFGAHFAPDFKTLYDASRALRVANDQPHVDLA